MYICTCTSYIVSRSRMGNWKDIHICMYVFVPFVLCTSYILEIGHTNWSNILVCTKYIHMYFVHMYICMYIHSFIHSYPIPTTYRMCIHMYICTYVCTYTLHTTHICTYVLMYVDTNIRYGTVLSLKTLHGMVWYGMGPKTKDPETLKRLE